MFFVSKKKFRQAQSELQSELARVTTERDRLQVELGENRAASASLVEEAVVMRTKLMSNTTKELDDQVKAILGWDDLVAQGAVSALESPTARMHLRWSAARPGMLMGVNDFGGFNHRTYLTPQQAADTYRERYLKVS